MRQFNIYMKKRICFGLCFSCKYRGTKNLDKESFVFMYEDKDIYEYSTILCFYKDKNYVYGLEADRFIPLFTNFDYDTIEILLSYNEFRQKKHPVEADDALQTKKMCLYQRVFDDLHQKTNSVVPMTL